MQLKEQQKQEALERMHMLKIMGNVRNAFRQSERVFYSERQNKFFDGILYWLDNKEEYIKIKNDFENEYGALVYHAQLTHTAFGNLLSFLYVSKHEDEWNDDKSMLKHGTTYAYVYNLSNPDMSEIGAIGVAPCNGGITRTF